MTALLKEMKAAMPNKYISVASQSVEDNWIIQGVNANKYIDHYHIRNYDYTFSDFKVIASVGSWKFPSYYFRNGVHSKQTGQSYYEFHSFPHDVTLPASTSTGSTRAQRPLTTQ